MTARRPVPARGFCRTKPPTIIEMVGDALVLDCPAPVRVIDAVIRRLCDCEIFEETANGIEVKDAPGAVRAYPPDAFDAVYRALCRACDQPGFNRRWLAHVVRASVKSGGGTLPSGVGYHQPDEREELARRISMAVVDLDRRQWEVKGDIEALPDRERGSAEVIAAWGLKSDRGRIRKWKRRLAELERVGGEMVQQAAASPSADSKRDGADIEARKGPRQPARRGSAAAPKNKAPHPKRIAPESSTAESMTPKIDEKGSKGSTTKGPQTESEELRRSKEAVAIVRSWISAIPRDSVANAAGLNSVKERQKEIVEQRKILWSAMHASAVEFERFRALVLTNVPDAAHIPSPCRSSMNGIGTMGDPVSNFSACIDMCELCRAEAVRCIDLVERALRKGGPTEAFAPEFVLRGRVEECLLQKRRRDEMEIARNRDARGSRPWFRQNDAVTSGRVDANSNRKERDGASSNDPPGDSQQRGAPSSLDGSPSGADGRIPGKVIKDRDPDIPKGWMTMAEAIAEYQVPPSSAHRWALTDLNQTTERGILLRSNQVIVDRSAFENLLRTKGRLDSKPRK